MKKFFLSILDQIIFAIWIYVMIFIPAFLIINFIYLFIQDVNYTKMIMKNVPVFDSLIIIILLIPSIGTLISIIRRKIVPICLWRMSTNKIAIDSLAAFLTTYIIWKFFLSNFSWQYIIFLFIFVTCLILIPQIPLFLNSIDITMIKLYLEKKPRKKHVLLQQSIKIGILLLTLIVIHKTVLITSNIVYSFNMSEQKFLSYPKINKIEPQIVYHGTMIIIRGNNFGYTETGKPHLYSQYGEIFTRNWSDTKIIFGVPLHWKLGNVKLWVEIPVNVDGKMTVVKSNVSEIRIISRLDKWDSDDNTYFEQFKTLDKETRELNGYK